MLLWITVKPTGKNRVSVFVKKNIKKSKKNRGGWRGREGKGRRLSCTVVTSVNCARQAIINTPGGFTVSWQVGCLNRLYRTLPDGTRPQLFPMPLLLFFIFSSLPPPPLFFFFFARRRHPPLRFLLSVRFTFSHIDGSRD